MKQKRNTYLFLLVLLAIIGVGFLIQRYFFGKTGATAIIEQDGETISELDLSKDTELVLDDGNGGSNTITVKNGKIAVTDARCRYRSSGYARPMKESTILQIISR